MPNIKKTIIYLTGFLVIVLICILGTEFIEQEALDKTPLKGLRALPTADKSTSIEPFADSKYDLGSETNKWQNLWADNANLGNATSTNATTTETQAANQYCINIASPDCITEWPSGGGSSGGLYGINVETLSGDKTLTPDTDEIYQYLDEGGASRNITLATDGAEAGDRFVIRHNGVKDDTHRLYIKQGATTLDEIFAGGIKKFIFDGTNWVPAEIGSGEDDMKYWNTSIGYKSQAYSSGAALGYMADGYWQGVAIGANAHGGFKGVSIGYGAEGSSSGIAIGYVADGHSYGIAIGYYTDTNGKKYSIALGYKSETERVGETSINIDGNSSQKNNVVQGRWSGSTSNDTPAEIYGAGYSTSRFTIRESSALAFTMLITAKDNTSGDCASYKVDDGLIKRDGSNNTTLSSGTVTTVHEDDASWDVAVTADDTNEALIITVTGDADNTVQWVARMDGVETHF